MNLKKNQFYNVTCSIQKLLDKYYYSKDFYRPGQTECWLSIPLDKHQLTIWPSAVNELEYFSQKEVIKQFVTMLLHQDPELTRFLLTFPERIHSIW